MDLDAFIDIHAPEWARLEELTRRRRLTGAEADELTQLYQLVATHLSTVRSVAPDPALLARLSSLVGAARTTLAGSHEPSWSDLRRFVVVSLPAALYRLRWWSITVTLVCVGVATISGLTVVNDPSALAAIGTPSMREQYVTEAFEAYYDPGAGFAGMVWTNNAWIAAQCVAFGITGAWPAYVLFSNAVGVGQIGGLMAAYDRLDVFFALILPHGLLELTAVFVAGAAGLRLFWTLVDPGPRPRARALAEEGRALFTVAIGLVAVLAVSGLIEGFVTGSTMVWWLKIAIGVVALAAFWAYTIVLGRRAVADGETGDLDADKAGAAAPLAA
ncbi:MAG: stage II sporulation protein M [Cellulomonadaceae bacterium]